jgi:hypothetical protein
MSLHLSLPEQFPLGLTPAAVRVHADEQLECVVVTVLEPGQDIELALGPPATVDMIHRLIGALDRLAAGGVVMITDIEPGT